MPSRDPLPARRRLLLGVGAAAFLGLSGLGVWMVQQRSSVPTPGTPAYEAVWTAWTNGLLALQTGDEKRAQSQLSLVTELLPNDAAGHADLALFYLRRGELEQAAAGLERAVALAPDNARIQALLALLESKRGDSAATIKYLRRALELSPNSLKARYALVQELERADENNLPEVQKQLQELSTARPANRLATLELARVAARRGDRATLRRAVASLSKGAAALPAEVHEQLAVTQKAVASNAPDAATQLIFLTNVLGPVPSFAQDRLELQSPPEEVGEPLESLLTLATPPSLAAPPDNSISFSAAPLFGAASKSREAIRAVYLGLNEAPAKGPPLRPAVVTLGAGALSRVDAKSEAPIASFARGANEPNALAVADWSNDFELDLAVVGSGGVRLFAARDSGQFQDVTAKSGLPARVLKASYTGAWPFDVEADGDLDFVLASPTGAPLVVRNNSDGTFVEARPFAGLQGVRGSAIGDFDSDADCDIAFLDAKGTLRVFSNERSGAFSLISPSVPPSAALCVADTDRDGKLDLLLWGLDGTLRRVRIEPDGKPPLDELAKTTAPANGAARIFAGDFDLNGGIDILVSSGATAQILLSNETGVLAALPLAIPLAVQDVADLDADGRLDLLGLDAKKRAATLLGSGTQPYNFQFIRPRAKSIEGDGRLNSFGVGGSVELRVGTLFQKQLIAGPLVHFGIGPAKAVNAARLLWPNGVAQAEFDLGANQSVLAEQRLSGSCPFLWAWNGQKMAFVKDCNWDSPLGLKINAQDTAGVVATEDWVKVRGDQLQPRNGFLELSLTADLWEAHFFDHVSLLAVDRPASQEAWVDERFAIPIPPLQVQASGPLRPVKSARNDRGADVTQTVRELDSKYLDVGRGRYQGVTRPHWVELDLSDAPANIPLWLIAEGWVHPTDSSINVALAQGKHAPPQSLSIQVADGRGGWRTVRSNLGFPSGKNKAVTLDLAGVFKPGTPRRLRLASNLEIYWDRLSWAEKKPTAAFKIQRLQAEASLRYRGFSQIDARDASSPELPKSYAPDAGVGQKWSDLIGLYTRWGDVRELVQKVDDRYVIMNAGDEMTLRFRAPAPPRAGWKRDYVFISDGWTKDGNLNTGLSKTLLPLPSRKSPFYPAKAAPLRDDPIFKRFPNDWARFHTRFVAPRAFNSVMLPPRNSEVVSSARAEEGARHNSVSPDQNSGEGSRVPVQKTERN
jgi:tetratricopeptide (TPR) repeat protein